MAAAKCLPGREINRFLFPDFTEGHSPSEELPKDFAHCPRNETCFRFALQLCRTYEKWSYWRFVNELDFCLEKIQRLNRNCTDDKIILVISADEHWYATETLLNKEWSVMCNECQRPKGKSLWDSDDSFMTLRGSLRNAERKNKSKSRVGCNNYDFDESFTRGSRFRLLGDDSVSSPPNGS